MVDAGITVAGSSDAPIERTDVLAAMAAATGSVPTGAEAHLGAVRPGHRADLVVLSDDPTDERVALDDIAVLRTVVAGIDRFVAPTDIEHRQEQQ